MKIVFLFKNRMHQNMICYYLEHELEFDPKCFYLPATQRDLLHILCSKETVYFIIEFEYFNTSSQWINEINESVNEYCEKFCGKRVVLVSNSNTWTLYKIKNIQFEAIVSINDDITELNGAIHAITRTVYAYPFISNDLKTVFYRVKRKVDMLSDCELEVLKYLAEGLSISDIATKKNKSINTISSQKISAMKKLDIQNNNDLLKFIGVF